ncbi:uncharacterized protein LOC109705017 [Ananas comosus]|uniref:Uncharacterized protein LOC109705017 n=1 Tax=Ananas comosus TaxID=4615 RepID=A0A6P5ED72_ANACO|nr:uncharacterized protein LOC109705017 [Ananas comosus]
MQDANQGAIRIRGLGHRIKHEVSLANANSARSITSEVPAIDSRPALLLTGSLDETVRLWHPDELAATAPPSRGHVLGVVAAAAHPSGSLAAAAAAASSLDSSVRVFDVDSNASIASLDASPPPPRSGACSSTPSGGAGAGVARGFVGLLAEVFPHRDGRRHLPGNREGHRGLHRRLS